MLASVVKVLISRRFLPKHIGSCRAIYQILLISAYECRWAPSIPSTSVQSYIRNLLFQGASPQSLSYKKCSRGGDSFVCWEKKKFLLDLPLSRLPQSFFKSNLPLLTKNFSLSEGCFFSCVCVKTVSLPAMLHSSSFFLLAFLSGFRLPRFWGKSFSWAILREKSFRCQGLQKFTNR